MQKEFIVFPCLRVDQPIGTFYIGVIDSHDLVAIAYADVRRPDGRDIERHIGTQRDLSEGRVAEIKQYVTTIDASFPTSIILAIESDYANFDEKAKEIKILKDDKIAKIIDGQHRIAGLEDYDGDPFQLNITIFIDMDIEDQAMVFATINLKQTKVTKSLAYDLYEYTESRSPQKTCHNIARLMNSRKNSPFFRRIKILGKSTGIATEVLTQSTFVDRLLKLISKDPMGDKDRIKRKKALERSVGKDLEFRIFRNRFIDEKDAEIAKILWNYFTAVAIRWPQAWSDFSRGMILARSTGFAALMRLLPSIMINVNETDVPSSKFFVGYLKYSTLDDSEFTNDNFKPGSSGESMLVNKFREEIL